MPIDPNKTAAMVTTSNLQNSSRLLTTTTKLMAKDAVAQNKVSSGLMSRAKSLFKSLTKTDKLLVQASRSMFSDIKSQLSDALSAMKDAKLTSAPLLERRDQLVSVNKILEEVLDTDKEVSSKQMHVLMDMLNETAAQSKTLDAIADSDEGVAMEMAKVEDILKKDLSETLDVGKRMDKAAREAKMESRKEFRAKLAEKAESISSSEFSKSLSGGLFDAVTSAFGVAEPARLAMEAMGIDNPAKLFTTPISMIGKLFLKSEEKKKVEEAESDDKLQGAIDKASLLAKGASAEQVKQLAAAQVLARKSIDETSASADLVEDLEGESERQSKIQYKKQMRQTRRHRIASEDIRKISELNQDENITQTQMLEDMKMLSAAQTIKDAEHLNTSVQQTGYLEKIVSKQTSLVDQNGKLLVSSRTQTTMEKSKSDIEEERHDEQVTLLSRLSKGLKVGAAGAGAGALDMMAALPGGKALSKMLPSMGKAILGMGKLGGKAVVSGGKFAGKAAGAVGKGAAGLGKGALGLMSKGPKLGGMLKSGAGIAKVLGGVAIAAGVGWVAGKALDDYFGISRKLEARRMKAHLKMRKDLLDGIGDSPEALEVKESLAKAAGVMTKSEGDKMAELQEAGANKAQATMLARMDDQGVETFKKLREQGMSTEEAGRTANKEFLDRIKGLSKEQKAEFNRLQIEDKLSQGEALTKAKELKKPLDKVIDSESAMSKPLEKAVDSEAAPIKGTDPTASALEELRQSQAATAEAVAMIAKSSQQMAAAAMNAATKEQRPDTKHIPDSTGVRVG